MPMIKKEESPPFIPVPASMAYMDERMDAYIKREEAKYKREDVKPNIKYEDIKPDVKFKRHESPSSSVLLCPDGTKRDRLPQFAYKWQGMALPAPSTTIPIDFQFYGVPTGWGVNMSDLMSKSLGSLGRDMIGGYDEVLATIGVRNVSFRIAWPGYQSSSEWIRPIPIKMEYGHISRADFAVQIAIQFSRFFEKAEYERPRSPEPGWSIARKTGVCFRQLYLVSVVNIFGDVWQADVIVERR